MPGCAADSLPPALPTAPRTANGAPAAERPSGARMSAGSSAPRGSYPCSARFVASSQFNAVLAPPRAMLRIENVFSLSGMRATCDRIHSITGFGLGCASARGIVALRLRKHLHHGPMLSRLLLDGCLLTRRLTLKLGLLRLCIQLREQRLHLKLVLLAVLLHLLLLGLSVELSLLLIGLHLGLDLHHPRIRRWRLLCLL